MAIITMAICHKENEMIYKIIFCSTAHFTEKDNVLLGFMSKDDGQMPWVFNTAYGYIIDLGRCQHIVLGFKRYGASKALRKFVWHMQRKYQAKYIHFDCDGEVLNDEEIFSW